MKKLIIISLSLLLVALGILVLLLIATNPEEEQIESFVLKNQTELQETALSYISGDPKKNSCKQVEIEGVFPGKNTIVQFSYSAIGIVPTSKYYGFYYSENDEPAAFQNADIPLEPTGENEWSWSDGTDNGGITERITENWFYYEAWF